MDLTSYLRDVPDFPKPGILFKDITPLLADPAALDASITQLAALGWDRVTKVVGIESRGFIFGVPLALRLGVGFVPVRKPGKLPYKTHSREYSLEYGTDRLEIHQDGVGTDDRVLVVDDLLATGGTMGATCELVEAAGATVAGCAAVIELAFLDGRSRLGGRRFESIIRVD